MAPIIENVLALEREADKLIEDAQAAARQIEREAGERIDAERHTLQSDAEQRIAAHRATAERAYQEAAAQAQQESAAELAALDQLPEAATSILVERIVNRYASE